MSNVKIIDTAVVLFIILTGAVLLVLTFTGILHSQYPGKAYLIALSAAFVILGLYSMVGLREGKLSRENAKTEAEIRKEAVLKMNDTRLIAKIAKEDPNPEVQETALLRLEEIASS